MSVMLEAVRPIELSEMQGAGERMASTMPERSARRYPDFDYLE